MSKLKKNRPLRLIYKNKKYYIIINGQKYNINIDDKKELINTVKKYKKIKVKKSNVLHTTKNIKKFMSEAIKQHLARQLKLEDEKTLWNIIDSAKEQAILLVNKQTQTNLDNFILWAMERNIVLRNNQWIKPVILNNEQSQTILKFPFKKGQNMSKEYRIVEEKLHPETRKVIKNLHGDFIEHDLERRKQESLVENNKKFMWLIEEINKPNVSLTNKKDFIINQLPEYKVKKYENDLNKVKEKINKYNEKKGDNNANK